MTITGNLKRILLKITFFTEHLQTVASAIILDLQKIYLITDIKNKHENSFKYDSKRSSTELSNFLWEQEIKKVDVSLQSYT